MFWHWLLPHKMPPKDTVDGLGGAFTGKNTGVVSMASRGSCASEQPIDREGEVNWPGSLPSLDSQWSELTTWLSECVIWSLWWFHVMPDSKPCAVQFHPITKAEGHTLHDRELEWDNRSWSTGAQFSSVSQSCRLFVTPWIAARQASLSITNSRSSLKLLSIESVMPSSHLILCHPLLLLLPIPPSIRVSSNESTLLMRWPKYWSFSFSIIPSTEHPGLISFRMDWLDLLAV